MISKNLLYVQQEITAAALRAGRAPKDVSLIAVSKTKPVSDLQEAYQQGQRLFGENKAQEVMDKYPVLPQDIQWHFIGHLQRNKVKYIIDKVCMIHSVDSLRLAEEIEKEAAKHGLVMDVLLEVNVAEEDTKFGLTMEEVLPLALEIAKLPHVHIRGLMTIAPYVEDAEENRPVFQKLYQLFIDIRERNVHNISMDVLSMGMTNDYVVAVEEGATLVRVGTGIFGERNYQL